MNILENASLNTGETGANNKVGGCDGMGATEITWPMLVGRMVKYVEAHNHDKDETTCLSVMKVLRSHLVRARSAEVQTLSPSFITTDGESVLSQDGTLGDMWDLPEDRLAAYIEKQTSFVELGVASIALRAIATHPASVEGNLADAVSFLLSLTICCFTVILTFGLLFYL